MSWILQLLLSVGWCDYWLREGSFEMAQTCAEQICRMASAPGEKTYLALGHLALARVALLEKDFPKAEEHLECALQTAPEEAIPLASWQAHHLGFEIHQAQDHRKKAQHHLAQCKERLDRLVKGLEEDTIRRALTGLTPL